MILADVEFELVFWKCSKCKHKNDPTETIVKREEMAFATCELCSFEEQILMVM